MKKFHKMLNEHQFSLFSDHKHLVTISGSKKDIPVYSTNPLKRWANMLLDYNFTIKYHSTNSIGHADDLFKFMNMHRGLPDDLVVVAIFVYPEIFSVLHMKPQFLIYGCRK